MSLEPYKRGSKWWVRGHVEYQGQRLTEYYRQSTGASEEAGAWRWCQDEEKRIINEHLNGVKKTEPSPSEMTFAEAVLKYCAKPKEAKYLIPIVEKIGSSQIRHLSPKFVRSLGAELYPEASTDTWTRQVITPVRAVINNLHDTEDGTVYRIRGYSKADKIAQDKRRGITGRTKYTQADWDWILLLRQHAPPRRAALGMLMFATGARISQDSEMQPGHVWAEEGKVLIPGAKGHESRLITIPIELIEELVALPVLYPRGWPKVPENLRLFGYAGRSGPLKLWDKTCTEAGIRFIPFHSAGR
ncbi:MAG: integrase, partial [Parachlamydiaceae bacterium]